MFHFSLQEESAESVCGAQLSNANQKIIQTLPLLTGSFASLNEYITIIVEGLFTTLDHLLLWLVAIQIAVCTLSSH